MKSRFLSNLTKPAGNYALIAEIKLKSPTEGELGTNRLVSEIVRQYQKAGVEALSVVTENHIFGGNLKLIRTVKKYGNLPVLCKDFVTRESQLAQIGRAGADAVLLLARLLDNQRLKIFSKKALKLKMLTVMEADNPEDLKRLISGKFPLVAVNARNLGDFTIDRERACRMLQIIPATTFKLAFSGVRDIRDIKKYLASGARGILVGTLLMKSDKRIELIRKFKRL